MSLGSGPEYLFVTPTHVWLVLQSEMKFSRPDSIDYHGWHEVKGQSLDLDFDGQLEASILQVRLGPNSPGPNPGLSRGRGPGPGFSHIRGGALLVISGTIW